MDDCLLVLEVGPAPVQPAIVTPAKCICLKLQNVFVLNCKMYLLVLEVAIINPVIYDISYFIHLVLYDIHISYVVNIYLKIYVF